MGKIGSRRGPENSRPQDTSDEALFQAYTRGDTICFEKLVDRYKNPLFAYLVRTVGNRAAAEDIFQESLEKVVRSAGRFDPGQRFSVWLYRIATNTAIDWLRRSARERSARATRGPENLSRLGARGAESPPHTARPWAQAHPATPEEMLTAAETGRALEEAVALLTEEQRMVFLLREETGLPFREIADTLDAPLNTVLVRMHRALRSIRRHLEERGVLD